MNKTSSRYYICDLEDDGGYIVKTLNPDLSIYSLAYGRLAVDTHEKYQTEGKVAKTKAEIAKMLNSNAPKNDAEEVVDSLIKFQEKLIAAGKEEILFREKIIKELEEFKCSKISK
jgi:Cft2 family RNA processing exonuclease